MRLYSYFRSSASYRVRIALALKGLPYEYRAVHLLKEGGQQMQPDFRQLSPDALVPVLEDEGQALTQSLAIIEYLDETHPQPALLPAEPAERARVRALALTIACDIHPLNNLRVRRLLGAEFAQDQAGVDRWCRRWIDEGFAAIEATLARTSDGRHCFAGRITLADVVLVPQVVNARLHAVDLTRYPTLASVAAHLETLEPFARAA